MTTAPLNIPSMEDFDIRINKLRQFKNLPELDKQEISNDSNIISTCEWNLDKMQDLTKYISFDDITCAIVVDGHGSSTVVNWLKSKPDTYFIDICKKPNPLLELENDLLTEIDSSNSGACISLIRTNMKNFVEVFYLGDVLTQIYINNKLHSQTQSHTAENPHEFQRKTQEGATFYFRKNAYKN